MRHVYKKIFFNLDIDISHNDDTLPISNICINFQLQYRVVFVATLTSNNHLIFAVPCAGNNKQNEEVCYVRGFRSDTTRL